MTLAKFEWSNDLVLGVDSMDHQHKVLVNKINDLVEELNKEEGANLLRPFQELAKFVIEHFQDEEAYMQSINFPGFAVHKQIHIQLLDKVGSFQSQVADGSVDRLKLAEFLKMWLKSHIMGIDAKYGEYSKTNVA